VKHILPPALVTGVSVAGYVAFNTASAPAADFAFYLYAASLVLGPLLVYPWMRSTGAGSGRAVLGSLFVPLLWLAKETYAVESIFGAAQALYYGLNPLSLGLFTGAALQMSVAELILLRARNGRWQLLNGAGAVVLLVAALAAAYAVAARLSDPTIVFWLYIEGYRKIFGG
jgi:hypothetical protein